MDFLLRQREQFNSEEEFQTYVLNEVRRFIVDLRLMNIELALRPNFGGVPISHLSATKKLASAD